MQAQFPDPIPAPSTPIQSSSDPECLPRAFVGMPQAWRQIRAWATQRGLGSRPIDVVLEEWLAARSAERHSPR